MEAHLPPAAIDERSSPSGLRAVALFEALKGTAVLLLGLGLLTMLHRDFEGIAENLLGHLHIDADHRIGRSILHAASQMTDQRVWGLALASVAYTTVRYVEAWGLWNRRVWAEWFALLSGTLYLPWEIVKLVEHRTWWHAGLLVLNVVIVGYMLVVRIRSCRPPQDC